MVKRSIPAGMLFLFYDISDRGGEIMTEYKNYAVIDIGSNSLRLMKGLLDRSGQWQFSPKELVTTRLGKDVGKTGRLWAPGREASLDVLERWAHQLSGIPVCAVATSAVREAKDGQAFLAEIRCRFGWNCRTVSGREEGSLSFCGATAAVPPERLVTVLDIGGGSSEMTVGKNGAMLTTHSYPLGAVRLTEGVLTTAAEIAAVELRCNAAWLPLPVKTQYLIGVGGTLTTLAAMDLGLACYDPKRIEGYSVSLERLNFQISRLTAMAPEERKHVAGLQPERSEIIVTGLIIARSFMKYYGFTVLSVSEKDLLEGVFYKEAFYDAARMVF
ncbi:Ppx/GppA phosphatase family protein [Megasphaera vaginalis (ex Srinivasan et al. 2021)]|uniref:Ppx/GppA phosphatase family protein n=2 Tax=Megasphaera vaginalis (ex Srinivasan et al. 2021) TaxID=1111454 RepID=U7UDL9_9FIRM|nr:Ppx/GppA phosphatase family protein [Megasphaera vaginalis (ex Srinivasan et al. 2021)]